MQQARFLCLAVSRRESGNCIAGIDIDSGKWLRPIHSHDRHAFADSELIVLDNHTEQPRFMAPLDLLSVSLMEPAGTNAQPENWLIAPDFFCATPTVLSRCTGRRTVQFLLSHLETSEFVLDTRDDSIAADACSDRALAHSLCLIRPSNLVWKVAEHRKHPGRVQIRAEFRSRETNYRLVVTDPLWEKNCQRAGLGPHEHSEVASPGKDLVLLTVSLAAVPYHGQHYKLVAGVIELAPFDSHA